MFLNGLGTAVPPRRFTQMECWAALQKSPQFPQLNARSRALLKKVLSSENGIATRHLAVANLDEMFVLTPDTLHARFAKYAPARAAQAAERALTQARLAPAEVDAVIISTCTGYLCPGLTSYVSERLGLRSDVVALDLVGQGVARPCPIGGRRKRCWRRAGRNMFCPSVSRFAARLFIWTTTPACSSAPAFSATERAQPCCRLSPPFMRVQWSGRVPEVFSARPSVTFSASSNTTAC
jgi:hypothetical protein